MQKELYSTCLYINFSQLHSNIQIIKENIKSSSIIAMIKANAYGCGDILIAKKLSKLGVNYFGVADFEEGIRLRDNGIKGPIMVMNTTVDSVEKIIEYNLEPVVNKKEILLSIIKTNTKASSTLIPIHIKINTGMNRWGVNPSDLSSIIKLIQSSSKKIVIRSIYSHLSSAENRHHDRFTDVQINKFLKIKKLFDTNFQYHIHTHILNSFGFKYFSSKINQFDHLRIGIALYTGFKNSNLKSILELRCKIAQIRELNINDTVGYSREFVVKKKMQIAIIPFGYADGLQRSWGNGTLKFYFKGHLLPTVGNISMDSCAIDITSLYNTNMINDGDEVIYFGKERSIWNLASELNTIPYEILATLSKRIKRIYYD